MKRWLKLPMGMLVLVSAFSYSVEAGGIVCSSAQEATNMMIKSQVFSTKLQQAYLAKKKIYDKAYAAYRSQPLRDSKALEQVNALEKQMVDASVTWMHYTTDTIAIGRVINQKAYQKACDQYASVAQKYGFDLSDPSVSFQKVGNVGLQKHAGKTTHVASSVCSLNDAIALSYKEEHYIKKLHKYSDAKSREYNAARNAALQNSRLTKALRLQREEIYQLTHAFTEAFSQKVKPSISSGHYDLACKNYKEITKDFDQKILALEAKQKQALAIFHKNAPTASSKASDANRSNVSGKAQDTFDGASRQKYNDMVDVINNFTPKVRSSFKTYVRSCGGDAHTRQKVMYSTVGGTKVKLPNSYAVIAYYKGHYRKSALKSLDDALSIPRLASADAAIGHYKECLLTFTKRFSEASEYYEMKDYTDDHFKKGDQMHAPLVQAYHDMIEADDALRNVTEAIVQKQELARIQAYKSSNQMMFYYVEKSKYLAKRYVNYASSKDDAMTLDAKKLRGYYDAQRKLYDEFKTYKSTHEQVFDDNSKYKYYLQKVRDYLAISKEFYIRVKSKKRFSSEGEKDFFAHLPPQARAAIQQNQAGSVPKLISAYNSLINEYNGLNM